jgi:hypothetical protein
MLRSWILTLGLPALVAATGLAIMTSFFFWPGVIIFGASGVWFTIDWWITSSTSRDLAFRLLSTIVIFIIFIIILVIVFWPAHLVVKAENGAGNYVPGTEIAGIKWSDRASEIRLNFLNGTDTPFNYVDIFFHSNLEIEKIGFFPGDNTCTASPLGAPEEIFATTTEGQRVPAFFQNGSISPRYRIHCDTISPNSKVSVIIELVALNSVKNGHWPQELVAPAQPARWLEIEKSYTAHYRPHHTFKRVCFPEIGKGKPCN